MTVTRCAGLLMGCLLLFAIAGCSGKSSGQRDASPTPDASTAQAPPSPAANDYPPPNPSLTPSIEISVAIARGKTAWEGPLVPSTVATGFDISVPKNWQPEQRENQDFVQLAYHDGVNPVANVAIQCVPDTAIEMLIETDRSQIFGLQIGYIVQTPRTATIAGRDLQEVRWTGGFGVLVSDNDSFYVQGPTCVWRLQFGVYDGLRIKDFRSQIEAIVASFQPKT